MSTTISKDVRSMFMGTLGTGARNQPVGNESFSQVFDKTQGSKQGIAGDNLKSQKSDKTENVQEHMNSKKNQMGDKLKQKIDELEKVTQQERLEQAAEEAGSTMVEKTADTFNVSVEEVETVLESMGLSPVDLLNCENLTKVVLALNPQLDALSVMTDANLYADLKYLMNLAEELTGQLKSQFNFNDNELSAYLESMKMTENLNHEQSILTSEDLDTDNLTQKEGLGDRLNSDNTTGTNTSVELSTNAKNGAGEESGASARHDDTGNMAKQTFAQNIIDNMAEAVNKAQGSHGLYSANGQEIIQQITDYIKVNVKADTTELELQLHPASLGNVKVQIASSEGVLTATFTTQNEAVKAALEAQLIQLKENFEQQGLKVESIEVNVATQGFERSLDQQDEGKEAYEQQSKKPRKIRLSGFEDISLDDLEEEDKVVADMMLRNGNTVDYTV